MIRAAILLIGVVVGLAADGGRSSAPPQQPQLTPSIRQACGQKGTCA